MHTKSQYEFTPAPTAEAAMKRELGKRVLVIDIESFWGGTEPNWTADMIHEIMEWSDFSARLNCWGGLVILAPDYTREQVMSSGYAEAWNTWINQASRELPLLFTLRFVYYKHFLDTDTFGAAEAKWQAEVQVYTKEYYAQFKGELDMLASDQLVDGPFGYVDSDSRYTSLLDAFEAGDVGVPTHWDDDGKDGIDEVVFVSWQHDRLEVRGFHVSRWYDPSGHLP